MTTPFLDAHITGCPSTEPRVDGFCENCVRDAQHSELLNGLLDIIELLNKIREQGEETNRLLRISIRNQER